MDHDPDERTRQQSISLAVASVPEGLPIVATMALARGMWRLAQRNALISNAIEHGAADVELSSHRDEAGLHIAVTHGGVGFPDGFTVSASPRLGLRIVDTLIREELDGTLTIGRDRDRTTVSIDLPPDRT